MSIVAGRRCLELALAITLALQSTTGWTVLLAVVVYWVVVAGLIDERAEARANVAGEPPGAAAVSDTPYELELELEVDHPPGGIAEHAAAAR
ncbi:hypothetical protein ABFU38_14980 [Xanthomonas campestris pv. raphani]|uniref:hypothetical protein n=1 Tax=Xanthomonas campestris TaxID=339 RepID=UPI00388E25E1